MRAWREFVATTIYKICRAALWREAERARRLPRRRHRLHATATSISRPPRRSPRPRPSILPAPPTSCWSRSTRRRSATALKWEPSRGGALFPASLRRAAADGGALGRSRCRSAPTAATSFRSSRRDRPVRRARAAADAACSMPRTPIGLAVKALQARAAAARRPRTTRALRCASSGSTSPIRSAWRPASTSTPRCRTRCCGSASASSRSAP